jgi:hypothetical protein
MNMQNVHAVEARAPFCQNDDCDIENERFVEARASFLKMCTPSRRERRFGPWKTVKKLMRFLRFCSKMSVSRKRNERLENGNSEKWKCGKTYEKINISCLR